MTYPQYYKKNDYKVECDLCGLTRKRSQCRLTWDGYLACIDQPGCWYPKHPLDTPPPKVRNTMLVKDPRPISTNYIYSSDAGMKWDTCFRLWQDLDDTIFNVWEAM